MNSNTIRRLLKSYSCFKGVFPSDRLPYDQPLPLRIIVNTDPHNKPGQHWVGISIDKLGVGYYFDSFGLPPLVDDIYKFITSRATAGWSYNKNHIQDVTSSTCGKYCVIFIIFMCNNLSHKFFIRQFGYNTRANDIKITKIIDNFSFVKNL